jgi:hypothetical protein
VRVCGWVGVLVVGVDNRAARLRPALPSHPRPPDPPCRLGVAGALHVRRVLCVCEEGRSAQHGGRAQLPA